MKLSNVGLNNFNSLSALYLYFFMQIHEVFPIKNLFLLMKVMAR